MKVFSELLNPEVLNLLRGDGVGVIRTDTLYGLVCRANNQTAVERIFKLKGRDDDKPPIVLIGRNDQLFDRPNTAELGVISHSWPGKVSLILGSPSAPSWISRGVGSTAYRLSADQTLQELILAVGPLIAPSANSQSQPPAMNVKDAIDYFGEQVDFYVDGGEVIDNTPSQLIRVHENGKTERLR